MEEIAYRAPAVNRFLTSGNEVFLMNSVVTGERKMFGKGNPSRK